LSATTPDGLYSLDAIVSDTELKRIDAEAIYSLPDEAARLAAMPYKYLHSTVRLLRQKFSIRQRPTETIIQTGGKRL